MGLHAPACCYSHRLAAHALQVGFHAAVWRVIRAKWPTYTQEQAEKLARDAVEAKTVRLRRREAELEAERAELMRKPEEVGWGGGGGVGGAGLRWSWAEGMELHA